MSFIQDPFSGGKSISPVPTNSLQVNEDHFISPESLMAYCSMRMRGIEDQIKLAFAKQEKSNADQKALGELSQWFHTYSYQDAAGIPGVTSAFDYAIGRVGADTDAGARLTTLKNTVIEKIKEHPMSPEDTEKLVIQTIKEINGDVAGGAELNMINLQSLMSQRQMAIQLSTNLIQMLGEMTNKIIANIHG